MWGLLTPNVFSMHSSVQISTLNQSLNTYLFNNTRKFFKAAGVEYEVDMKRHLIIVNNGINSAFIIRFEDFNYIRASRIPKGKIEVLFQANTPEMIIKKLFDFKFLLFTEISRMVAIANAKPKPMEVIEIPPASLKSYNVSYF